jgi:hypothetical protein
MTKQQEAIDAVICERQYQDNKWNNTPGASGSINHTNTEFLVYINHYVQQSMAHASTTPDNVGDVLKHNMRKIAALVRKLVTSKS